MDTKNFLSDEEQKHFDKYLADFEAKDRSLIEEYNKENKYVSVAKNRSVVIGVIGITAILSLIGIGKSFININDTKKHAPEATVVAEAPQPTPVAETESTDEEMAEESDEMNQQELDELKKNFNPFGNEMNGEQPMPPDTSYQQPYENHSIMPSSPPPVYNQHNNIPVSTEAPPVYNQPPMEQQPMDGQITLKGFAREGNSVSCYIALNNSTGKYYVGDQVGRYTVQSIQSNYVMLVDENGNQKALVK